MGFCRPAGGRLTRFRFFDLPHTRPGGYHEADTHHFLPILPGPAAPGGAGPAAGGVPDVRPGGQQRAGDEPD